jgi:hypothetical protein
VEIVGSILLGMALGPETSVREAAAPAERGGGGGRRRRHSSWHVNFLVLSIMWGSVFWGCTGILEEKTVRERLKRVRSMEKDERQWEGKI